MKDGIYHVMARGNRKANLFEDDRDRTKFIKIVVKAVGSHGVRVFAQSLLGNHYHQVVQTPQANLSRYMRDVNGQFAKYSNARHGRIGHLFNEPYQPILIDNTTYLRVAIGYVVMNAVNHGFVQSPEDWRWSTYRATVGLTSAPDYLCLDWLDDVFPAPTRAQSRALFREYLTGKTWTEAEEWLTKPAVGSTEFEREVRQHIGATMFMCRLPRSYRLINRPSLSELFPIHLGKPLRNRQMLRAHVVHAYSITDIARALSMHPGSVSRIVAALRRRAGDEHLRDGCSTGVEGEKAAPRPKSTKG